MTAKVKKLIRQCPFLLLLVSTGILFTLIGLCGKKNVYDGQEYDPLKEPVLVMMFKGLKEDVYPWQIFGRDNEGESVQAMASGQGDGNEGMAVSGEEEEDAEAAEEGGREDIRETDSDKEKPQDEETDTGKDREAPEEEGTEGKASEDGDDSKEEQAAGEADNDKTDGGAEDHNGENSSRENDKGENTAEERDGLEEPRREEPPSGGENLPGERIEPFRESTREEYLNHISADIYGDAGVKRAAEYEFVQVDESYFDDALFIGDSRTVGLRDYTDLSEHADFYCETSLTIQKMLEENFPGLGTIEEALEKKEYGKIYIMLGINELGVGTTENFMGYYTDAVDFLCEKEPDAKIFIQGIMRVTGKKNSTDAIFNNSNINARNNAIATLADNERIFYIDVNEVVCDEEGNLNSEYTYDQLHLLGVYDDLWKQFLLSHGVVESNSPAGD